MNPAAPLLFFDSGVGGLSVLAPTPRAAADRADRLRRRQRRLPLRHQDRGGDRVARAGAARPPGRALPAAAGGHRLQHRLHHRARPCPRRARPAGRRHRPGDQARRRAVEDPRHRRARHRSDHPPALCRRPRRQLRRRLHRRPPRLARAGRAGRAQAGRRAGQRRGGPRRRAALVRAARRRATSTSSSSPAPTSRCSRTSSRQAFPGLALGRRRRRHRAAHRLPHPRPALARRVPRRHRRLHRPAAAAGPAERARRLRHRRSPSRSEPLRVVRIWNSLRPAS